jgi:putative protein kinase ArgK-like GTPase of G3E family
MEWLQDYDAFQEVLDDASRQEDEGGGFNDSLAIKLSLVLEELYNQFQKNACGVSAVTGDGIPEFWKIIEQAAKVDFEEYLEDLKHRIQEQEARDFSGM